MTDTLRLFLAIELPAAERRAIHAATAPLRDAARAVAWVREENLHLTLKFLGSQPAGAVERLRDALAPAMAAAAAPTLELGGLGAFPDLRAPRVIWMGVHPDPRLELVHHDVEVVCGALGYEVDGRAFRPHLTLGRVRDRLPAGGARAIAEAARGVHYRGRAAAASLDVMASELTPQGARYRVMARLPLKGGA